MAERLEAKLKGGVLVARKIDFAQGDDLEEMCYQRGWTDGLPVTPPTDVRVLRMLKGTSRKPDEIVGKIPPYLAPCTVEKVAINAVMAGCLPEYMPVLLAVIEAALEPVFTLHGVLATTYFSGPVIIVNGPVVTQIGMNCGINALGQGNRANMTIGRALNLIVRNVGGGKPGEADRATLGAPSKIGLCFAEDESDADWEPLSVARGFKRGESTVTLFQGHGVEAFVDQKSRTPEGLSKSFATSLEGIAQPLDRCAAVDGETATWSRPSHPDVVVGAFACGTTSRGLLMRWHQKTSLCCKLVQRSLTAPIQATPLQPIPPRQMRQ